MTTAMGRGLGYPATRRVDRLTKARLMLLEGAGEEEFSRFVKARAHVHRWNGWHVRDSEGVMEGVHTLRLDGFTEAKGVPDWYFWHEERHQHFWAELKGASGHLSGDQKREITSMRRGGETVFTWWPRDALEVERVFQHGLETN
jgi:hypothetical protein